MPGNLGRVRRPPIGRMPSTTFETYGRSFDIRPAMTQAVPTSHVAFRSAQSSPADRYEVYEGIHVLRIGGDDYEMGYQHGSILAEAIARGPLRAFSRYVERMFATGLLGPLGRPLGAAIGIGLGETVGRRIANGFPPHVRRALEGLADGARIPRGELLRAVTMPETYLWLLHQYKRIVRPAPAPRFGVPVFGCTSALAWGDATTQGRLLHGRNFDYQGVGSWDREQAVVFHEPSGGQRYVSISAAGILLGGITAMNESGLTLVVHQHMAFDEMDLRGVPVGVVGDAIMRHARNLDDARRILDDHVPNAGWTYLIASAREKSVLCYEVSPSHRQWFLPEGDTFAYSNIFLGKAFAGRETFFYPTYWRHNVGRYHRATELLEKSRGQIDESVIAAILGDTGDERCRFRDAIAMLMTVASVVFDPERGIVYVATGRAPVSNEPYVAFDLSSSRPRKDLPKLVGGTRVDTARREAFRHYRDAYEACFHHDDRQAARRNLDLAIARDPKQPVYHFVAGLLALADGELVAARRHLDEAIALGHPDPERVAGFRLWRARVLDRLGERDAALGDYREAVVGDEAVRAAAKKGLKRPWRGGVPAIEWSFGEVVGP